MKKLQSKINNLNAELSLCDRPSPDVVSYSSDSKTYSPALRMLVYTLLDGQIPCCKTVKTVINITNLLGVYIGPTPCESTVERICQENYLSYCLTS